MIESRIWLDREVFYNLRRLSATLIELRIVYSGPNGYEGGGKFAKEVWDIRRTAFGRNADDGYAIAQNQVVPLLDGGFADKLRSQMNDLLNANEEHFVGWLEQIGVAPGSQLQRDFLRTQALFAVAAGVLIADGDLGFFKDFTWVYPFC